MGRGAKECISKNGTDIGKDGGGGGLRGLGRETSSREVEVI